MNLRGIVRGALFSFIIAAVFLFAAAAAVYFGIVSERVAGVGVYVMMLFGVFFGALGAAKTAERKKLFNALAVSLVFALAAMAVAAIVNGAPVMTLRTALVLSGAVVAGAAAAIFAA